MADALRHDVLMGTAVSLKSGDTQVGVTGLKHVLSVVRVKITSPKVLTAVGIQSDGGLYQTVTIAADGTVTPGETDKLTTNVTAAPTVSGNVYTVYIPIYPKTTQNLKVVATAADNSAYSFTIASKDVDYTAGQVYGKTMSYLINANNTISEWTESASAGDATVNDHDYVILDTADGIKWATTNVGASLPADYGDYFAWGATSAYTYISDESTTGSNKPWSESNPSGYYNGSEATLPANHDIATILWGGKWKMPTKAQLETLMNYGSKTWTTQKNSKGEDVYGYLIKSTSNTSTGKSIFLPAAGYRYNSDLINAGSYGNYWSSTAGDVDSSACRLYFGSGNYYWYYDSRYFGSSVRPVTE